MAYVPVLKGKPGEFKAWRNINRAVARATRPLFEVVPTHGPDYDLDAFVRDARNSWPIGPRLTYDTGYVPEVTIGRTGRLPVLWTARALARGDDPVPACPVVRIEDSDDVLVAAGEAVKVLGEGACLRLGSEESDPDPTAATAELPRVVRRTGLSTDEIDLVIDLWAVESSREARRAAVVGRAALRWAAGHRPWRSVAVVSGAFPASISNLPTGRATALPRCDAEVFDILMGGERPIDFDYGDYVVAHPSMPAGGRAPLPNLRYTVDRNWMVYRERKVRPGNESFFTLCQRLVATPAHWAGRRYSWGDREIDEKAAEHGGAGRALEWRAYGTSHHVAHVVDRLATLGVP